MKTQTSQLMPKYKFYATLLDSFQYYLKSEYDDAFEEFINKLNRVPFESESARKGTSFNNLIDELVEAQGNITLQLTPNEKGVYVYGPDKFKAHIVDQFYTICKFGKPQVFVSGILKTSRGPVELYGYMDYILPGGNMIDIKTTGSYTFPKYLHNWQHIVYPFCMNSNGMPLNHFSYEVTDFNNYMREDYLYNEERDLPRLTYHVEHLIDFIEQHRELITDKKLFALDAVPVE